MPNAIIMPDFMTLALAEAEKAALRGEVPVGAVLVSPQLLERYAMSVARWIQCEEAVTEYGFLAKHPTTGNAIQSPYVAMGQNYMNQTNRLWMEIFQIVKENCTGEYSGVNPQDDVMERLLTARKGK